MTNWPLAMALNVRGLLRVYVGDGAGLDDLEASLAMFVRARLSGCHHGEVATSADGRLVWNGPADAAPMLADAIAHGSRTHNTLYEMLARCGTSSGWQTGGVG